MPAPRIASPDTPSLNLRQYTRFKKPVSPLPKLFFMVAGLFIIFILFSLTSRYQELHFIKPIGTFLPPQHIYCIKKDGQRLWIGTDRGVRCYNLQSGVIQVFTPEDGLVSHHVEAIAVGEENVWFGGYGGLSKYSKNEQKITPVIQKPEINIQAISLVNSQLWLGTNKGVFHFLPQTRSLTVYTPKDGLGSESIYAILAEKEILWFGGRRNILSKLERKNKRWQRFAPKGSFSLHDIILDIRDRGEYLLVTTSYNGVYKFEKAKGIFHPIYSRDITYCLTEGERGDLWYGCRLGLVKYEASLKSWITLNLPCLKNKKGEPLGVEALEFSAPYLWIGRLREVALIKYLEEKMEREVIKLGLQSPYIKTLLATDKSLWVGYGFKKKGISSFDLERKTWCYSSNLPRVNIIKKQGSKIWCGTWDGAWWFDEKRKKWQRLNKVNVEIKSLFVDEEKVWLGTSHGLLIYDKKSRSYSYLIPHQKVISLIPYQEFVWVVTQKGTIIKFNSKGEIKEKFTFPKSSITALIVLNKKLWLGTASGGVFVFTQGRLSPPLKQLPSPITTGLSDGERLYWGTRGGLAIYFCGQGKWLFLSRQHGLPYDEILSLQIKGDTLWVGTWGGIILLKLSKIFEKLTQK
jgi:ligand-binding sensor domain-containing protein